MFEYLQSSNRSTILHCFAAHWFHTSIIFYTWSHIFLWSFTYREGFMEVLFSVHIGFVIGVEVRSSVRLKGQTWSMDLPPFMVAVSFAKSILVWICRVLVLQLASFVRLLTKRGISVDEIILIDGYFIFERFYGQRTRSETLVISGESNLNFF